ncbi:putative AP-1-like transcription factor [Xylogone sp. PMI_703]|nr:putative AP-1-like transcription factor [Xylogone sp. PMI_703]
MMAAGPFNTETADSSYYQPVDMAPVIYDSNSDSSTSSPVTTAGFDGVVFPGNAYLPYPAFPIHYPITSESLAQMGMIPVELDIKGLYEDHDRRRKRNGEEKIVSSHVHSRRRAQNRASQRAFRDRKEKHMRELEARLTELEGRHSELTASYDSLQVEYATAKEELDRLRKENDALTGLSGSPKEYQERVDGVDPLLFDVSAYCYDEDGESK